MIPRRCARGQHCSAAVRFEVGQCAGDCDCHLGPHYPCSIEGGCGHLHVTSSTLVGAAIAVDRGLCDRCELTVSDALDSLPHDYVSLRVAQYRGMSPTAGEVVAFSKELPIPISLTFAVLADQITVETVSFAEPVAEKLGIDWDRSIMPKYRSVYGPPPAYAGPVVLHKATRLLANATDILLGLPLWTYRLWGEEGWTEAEADGVTAALMLLDLHHATRATLGLTRAVSTMQAKCPYCESYTLVRVAGDEFIHCQLCRRRFTDKEYERWTVVVINEHDPEILGKSIRKIRLSRKMRKPQEELQTSAEGTVGRPHREAM